MAERRLRTPDVAARLGISGAEVYRLIFAGELAGRPDEEGIVYVTQQSLEDYLIGPGRANASTAR